MTPIRVASMVVATVLTLAGCGSEPNLPDADVARIVVAYQDSSVPPSAHRSWRVEAAAGEGHADISGYDGVLSSADAAIPTEVLADVLDRLGELGSAPDDEPCAGGTGFSVTVSDGDGDVRYRESTSSCGDAGREWIGDAKAAVAPLVDTFDWQSLYAEADAEFERGGGG